MPIRLSCPSCNTSFTLPDVPADRRALCPRCGDMFPIYSFEEVAGGTEARPVGYPPPGYTPDEPPQRSAAKNAVLVVVAVVLGLGAAIWTARVANVPPPGEQPRPAEVAGHPGQLEGVGYLPADDNVVFVLQPGAVQAYATRTNRDARDVIVKAGVPTKVLDAITGLGFTLDQIDHLAGGTSVGNDAVEFRVTLALVLRTPPADEEEMLRRLKAKRRGGGRDRHEVELSGIPMNLVRVSPTVWVFGLDEKKDLAAVDRGGYRAGGKQFGPGLVNMIEQHVPRDAAAWVATNDERWAEKPGVRFLAETVMKRPEWLPVLAKGRAGMAALTLGDPPRGHVVVRLADEAAAKQTREYFKARAGTDDKVRPGGEGEFATLDTPIDPSTAFATLQQLLGDAVKN